MRSGFTWLATLTAAAIALGACEGKPGTVTGFKLGADHRPNMSTVVEVESVEQALILGLAYWRNCAGEQAGIIYGKEAKVCMDGQCSSSTAYPTACVAFGAGGYDNMAVSFDSFSWPAGAWSSIYGGTIGGQLLNTYRPQSFRLKATDYPFPPTTHSDIEFYKNNQFGGGCAQVNTQQNVRDGCFPGLGQGATFGGTFLLSSWPQGGLPGSVEFSRYCGGGGGPLGGGNPC